MSEPRAYPLLKFWQPFAIVVTTLLLANGAAAHEAPLPAPFAVFDRASILDAIVKKPHIPNAVDRFLMLGRGYGGTIVFYATLRTVSHRPHNDVDLVTRERGHPPVSQRYRFNGHFFEAIKANGVSLVPSIPLRYDAGQRAKLHDLRIPVMVPTRIPAEWIGQSPSVQISADRHLTALGVSIGYGRNCDGTTACTDANVSSMRSSLGSCEHAKV